MVYKLSDKGFNKKLSHACKYCLHAYSCTDTEILCKHKGVVGLNDCCRKYKYDPLKREPQIQSKDISWSAKDFDL